jgi:hypothetical protein
VHRSEHEAGRVVVAAARRAEGEIPRAVVSPWKAVRKGAAVLLRRLRDERLRRLAEPEDPVGIVM